MSVAIDGEVRRQPALVAMWSWLSSLWRQVGTGSKSRRLRVCESLSLGEKRFVAVVQFETQQFLIGGGPASVNLLARLGETADFAEVLTEWCERQR
jgi:flagellar biogenesis protein FliO